MQSNRQAINQASTQASKLWCNQAGKQARIKKQTIGAWGLQRGQHYSEACSEAIVCHCCVVSLCLSLASSLSLSLSLCVVSFFLSVVFVPACMCVIVLWRLAFSWLVSAFMGRHVAAHAVLVETTDRYYLYFQRFALYPCSVRSDGAEGLMLDSEPPAEKKNKRRSRCEAVLAWPLAAQQTHW